MTEWTDDRIPLWVPPVEGESLDSWLAAYARRLRTGVPQFLSFIGLHRARPNHMVRYLTDRERQVLSERTGLASEELTPMTLEPWDGVAVNIDRPTRRLSRPPNWRHTGNTSRFCPGCLDESAGRWQISWRLPWSFTCTRHGMLLLDCCPECGQPPVVHGRQHLRNAPAGVCLYGTGTAGAAPASSSCRTRLPPSSLQTHWSSIPSKTSPLNSCKSAIHWTTPCCVVANWLSSAGRHCEDQRQAVHSAFRCP